MQKFLKWMMALTLAFGFLAPVNNVSAETYTVDQSCSNTDVTTYENIAINTPREQGFRPTQNRLKEVNLKIGGLNLTGGTPIKLTVLPYNSATVLGEKVTLPTVFSPSIRTWTFDNEITLTPDARYVLRLEKASGPGTPYWYTNDGTCYSRGAASGGGTVMGYDYDFATVGYTYTAPKPVEPTPEPSTTTPTTSTETSQSDILSLPTPNAVPVDNTLKKPVLITYEKNSETVSPPFDKEINFNKGEKIKLTGTSFAEAQVLVFAGGKSHTAEMMADGNWTVEITIDDFVEGSQIISAQAQKGTLGSEIADLLIIKVLGATAENNVVTQTDPGISTAGIFAILILLLIILILLLIYLERKYHGLSKLFKRETKI